MTIRKHLAALITLAIALAVLSSSASAQCGGAGTGGSTRIGIAVVSDQGEMLSVPSYDLDLLTRVRFSMFTLFSWGRGPVAHPGSLRSSIAVLRERRGLMR